MTTIHDLTAHAQSSAYATKELSPVEVTRAALARIEAWEKTINAMYVVDATGALVQATASEARWRAGTPLSTLDGVPITIKDNIPVKGIPTPVGTAAGALTPADADAPPAVRVREAGCVILGKTTMPDFGMLASGVSSLHGITRNPWNLARNPAGSSSGAGRASSPAMRRSRLAPTSAVRCGCPRPITVYLRSNPRSAASRSIRRFSAASPAR
jgi:Asp-tRNA(Asn)/Glu-tRNA(Gln) amidotransferase A subunit family amidase